MKPTGKTKLADHPHLTGFNRSVPGEKEKGFLYHMGSYKDQAHIETRDGRPKEGSLRTGGVHGVEELRGWEEGWGRVLLTV